MSYISFGHRQTKQILVKELGTGLSESGEDRGQTEGCHSNSTTHMILDGTIEATVRGVTLPLL